MSRRITIIILSLALLAAVGWGFWERANRMTLANAVEAGGQRDFYNLLNYVEQSQVSMGKFLASNSPSQQAVYLTEAWNQSAAAHLSLSQLPIRGVKLINTSKFLAQVSDYSNHLAQKLARGESLTQKEKQQISRLRDEMGQITKELRKTEEQVSGRQFRWSSFYGIRMPAPLKTIASTAVPVQGQPSGGAIDGFVNTDRYLQTLPSLNYDGPFSDHMEKLKPMGLEGSDITQADAEKKAVVFANNTSINKNNYQVKNTRTSNGRIPTFAVSLNDPGRPDIMTNVYISKQGGKVVTLLNNRIVDAPALDAAKAMERAVAFLKKNGFDNMQPSYSVRTDNNQVITFAAKEGDIILYPDQVKVKVALDNGDITGWDASQYYMAHHKRQLPQPKLTPEEAKTKINPRAKIEGIRKALIPLPGGTEVLTYEVSIKIDDTRYLIYINALTGKEEKVMQIIDVPGGQLTM